jgi:hypothetical protein
MSKKEEVNPLKAIALLLELAAELFPSVWKGKIK